MGRQIDGFSLEVLLEELARVADSIGGQGVVVLGAEASQGVEGGDDKVEGRDPSLSLGDVLFENNEGLGDELIGLIFQSCWIVEVVDGLDSLEMESKSQLRVVLFKGLNELGNHLEDLVLVHSDCWHWLSVFIVLMLFLLIVLNTVDLTIIDGS